MPGAPSGPLTLPFGDKRYILERVAIEDLHAWSAAHPELEPAGVGTLDGEGTDWPPIVLYAQSANVHSADDIDSAT